MRRLIILFFAFLIHDCTENRRRFDKSSMNFFFISFSEELRRRPCQKKITQFFFQKGIDKSGKVVYTYVDGKTEKIFFAEKVRVYFLKSPPADSLESRESGGFRLGT